MDQPAQACQRGDAEGPPGGAPGPAVSRTHGRAADYYALATEAFGLGQWQEAEGGLRRAIALQPDLVEAHYDLGRLLQERGRLAETEACYRRALELRPDLPEAHNNLGNVLTLLGRHEEAIACYRRALSLQPAHVGTLNNLGNALQATGALAEAEACYRRAIALDDRMPQLHYNLANLLTECGSAEEALAAFDRAITHSPDYAQAHVNRGNLLQARGRTAEAEAAYRRAIAIAPGLAEAHNNLGNLLKNRGHLEEALAAYERAVELRPAYAEALAHLAHLLQHVCHWRRLESVEPRLDALTERALAEGRRPGETPFLATARSDDPERLHAIARAWAADMQRRMARLGTPYVHDHRRTRRDRLTIGYLSGDFRAHPVTHTMLGVLAHHDRDRFRIVGYGYGPGNTSPYRARVRNLCDRFVDIDAMRPDEAARRIHDDGIDILVDLTGHTRGSRTELCALRPAPVQAAYLGFPGTSGAAFIDYLIADRVVCPPEHRAHYTEAVVRLPHSFTAHAPAPALTPPPRAAFGLPEDAVVLCSFNASFKIDRASFELWLRILARVPETVLWLARSNPLAERHLRRAMRHAGIDVRRLVLADRLPYEAHLERVRLADLALDTLTYNGGVTTLNALAAGVPVVCMTGRHYVSRMAASMVTAAGLDELVATGPEGFAAVATALARDRARREALRARLRRGAPALDPARLTRPLEEGFRRMWAGFASGGRPTDIDLEA